MELKPGRVRNMIADCTMNDTYIPCHEHMKYVDSWPDDDDETDYETTDDSPVCRGFYDRYYLTQGTGQMIRIAERLRMVRFVDSTEILSRSRPRS
jgi:hypothetical protein